MAIPSEPEALMDPAPWFALICAHVVELRRSGVLVLELGPMRLQLAPPTSVLDRVRDPEPADPLDDPATFGGSVPGFVRLHQTDEVG